jgi:ribosomal protein S18 acetylase RimI-like enzyme
MEPSRQTVLCDHLAAARGSFGTLGGTQESARPGGTVAGLAIREAVFADSEAIAKLVSELGYSTTTSQMERRLEAILEDEDYHTLVACEDGRMVGLVGTRRGPLYEDDGHYGQIMALAVAPEHQRRGVGRMLIRAAESRLVEHGARVLVVTSGNHRPDAHAFYERGGYSFTGRRYKKSAAASA